MPLLAMSKGCPAIGLPSKVITPERIGKSPMMVLSVVDFPPPLRPRMASTRPFFASSDRPYRTCVSPYPDSIAFSSSIFPTPQIDFPEQFRSARLVQQSVKHHLAIVQHGDRVGHVKGQIHVMLDDQHGQIAG